MIIRIFFVNVPILIFPLCVLVLKLRLSAYAKDGI